MRARLSQVHWDLIVKAAVVVYLVTLLLGLAVSFLVLALLNWAHLHSLSASQAPSLISAFLVIVVTAYGAWWVARRVDRAALLHGFFVGLLVALLSFLLDLLFLDLLFRRALEPKALVLYVLMVAAGLLGGFVGSRRRRLGSMP